MYTIKLTQYAFDNTYTNARLFENKSERDAYFDNLQGYTFNKDVNFIARDIIATDIDIKVEPPTPLFVLLNYNYCVVKNDNETLYFYIRKSEQLSGNLIRCRLENDIIQNYIYDAEFSDCMITKAHINTFIDNGDGTVTFDGTAQSKLFEREEIKDLSKRLVHREKLITKIDTSSETSEFNKWISENVFAWCYVCLSYKEDGYIFQKNQNETQNEILNYTSVGADDYLTRYSHTTLCFPVMKKGAYMSFIDSNSKEFVFGNAGFEAFLNLNNGYANIYTVKLSLKPPFNASDYSGRYRIYNNALQFYVDAYSDTTMFPFVYSGNYSDIYFATTKYFPESSSFGILYITNDNTSGFEMYIENKNILPKYTFNKNEIIGANRNIVFNPKLNNSDYKELRLSFIGTSQSYDLQKLNDANPKFLYKEMIGADISKGNIKYKSENENNIFNLDYTNSYNGLSYTNDMSLPIANNIFDQYLANNKNAYLSFQNQQESARNTAIIGALGGMVGAAANWRTGGGVGGFVTAAASGITNIAHTITRQTYEETEFNLSLDNMRSAPQELQNNNGNAIQAMAISPLGIYIEIYEALPNELEIANNITYDKGFIYNQYDNIKNHMYTRKYFNYIKANVENIKADLSNDIKLRMRQIFANGIKFWHTDDIIFNKENYERSLEANG